MDPDIEMQDANGAEYPEPTIGSAIPYPSLPNDTTTPRPQALSNEAQRLLAEFQNTNEPRDSQNNDAAPPQDVPQHENEALQNEFIRSQQAFMPVLGPGLHDSTRPPASSLNQNPNKRRRGWKWALRGTDHADLFAKPKVVRTKRGRKPGRRPGRPRASVNASGSDWIDPGAEFRNLQRNATSAFLEGDLDTALEYAKLAVLQNSEVFMTHKMISDIYQQQGKERDAVLALWSGANTVRNAGLWADVGNRVLGMTIRQRGDAEWARTCFSEAIKIDKDSYAGRTGKLKLHIELEEWDAARLEGKAIATKWPDDLEYVHKYAELCLRSDHPYEWQRAREVYEKAIEAWEDNDMLGEDEEYQWIYLDNYLGILMRLSLWPKGVKQTKRLARWFLGRKQDTFWDDVEDDREFDSAHERRMQLVDFRHGSVNPDPARYGDGLPIDIRIKLGLFRLRERAKDEAFRHFEMLQQQNADVEGLEHLFIEVAECLKFDGLFQDALKFFEPLMSSQSDSNTRFWLSLASCYAALDQRKNAEECYLKVTVADKYDIESRIQLARMYNADGQSDKAFILANEVTNLGKLDPPRPKPAPKKVIPREPPRPLAVLRPKPSEDDSVSVTLNDSPAELPAVATPVQTSLKLQRRRFSRRKNSTNQTPPTMSPLTPSLPSATAMEERSTRIQRSYAMVKNLWPSGIMEERILQQWIHHAVVMAEELVEIDALFAAEASSKSSQTSHLPQALVHEMEKMKKKVLGGYRKSAGAFDLTNMAVGLTDIDLFGIPTGEWHYILAELALQYVKTVEQEKCYDVLQNCLKKPLVFQKRPDLMNTTQALSMHCALAFNDSRMASEVAREFVLAGQKRSSSAAQLLAAVGRLSYGESYFYDKKIVRLVQEVINAQEKAAKDVPAQDPVIDQATNQSESTFKTVDGTLNEPNANVLTMRAHSAIQSSHNNAQPAIPLLLRAFVQEPENIVTNLSLATAYITEALRNNSKNVSHDIMQGQAFFFRYYDLRKASGRAIDLQEAEFNLGRFWYQLGMKHAAKKAFEKVLVMSDDVQEEAAINGTSNEYAHEDYASEAAFALQRMYLDAGNEGAARAIAEEWLVL